jgi:kynurenine formamidase
MYIDLSLPISDDCTGIQASAREESLMPSGHKGTHLDRLLNTKVPLEYVKSRALKFDVSKFTASHDVEPTDLAVDCIQAGDFVVLHTGCIERYGYASKAYMEEHVALSWALIESLLARKIHFIGVDARGIRENQEHRRADELCERSGTYVIENINNTTMLPANVPFTIYAFCFDLGGSGLPCRVIAEI